MGSLLVREEPPDIIDDGGDGRYGGRNMRGQCMWTLLSQFTLPTKPELDDLERPCRLLQ